MLRHAYRAATWVLVAVVMASSLGVLLGAATPSTTSYVLTGYVDQPGVASPPVPAGVTVDLVSRASGATYTSTVTGTGGQFTFTTSSTSGALGPGYWSLFVPPQTNATFSGCKPCAAVPVDQTPTYQYLSTQVLTNANYSVVVHGVSILPYNATISSNVTLGSAGVGGVSVKLLDPTYNGLVLANNTTSTTTGIVGHFTLQVPFGTYVLQATHPSGSIVYVNTTEPTISKATTTYLPNLQLQQFEIAGHVLSSVSGDPVPTTGNATLFDPATGDVYTTPIAGGGFYSLSSYPAGFSHGATTFDVITSVAGYQTGWFSQPVSGTGVVNHDVTVPPIKASTEGNFTTKLDFSSLNVVAGRGDLWVNTTATLGNNSVMPGLPNGTVGQLWAQLGLDFNHSLSLLPTQVKNVESWINSTGPFFPAGQAQTTLNGSGFNQSTVPTVSSFTPPVCTPSCGLTSTASLGYTWSTEYALNGTVPKSAGSYSLAFKFAHPSFSSDVFNYTVVLPTGYVLSAGTTAPANAKLHGSGPSGTWTTFTLESLASATTSASATFSLVRAQNLTAIVNVTSTTSTFSKANILNSTRGYYTVVLGVNENATFSGANSTFPAGINGTSFTWNWADGSPNTVTPNTTTNHAYKTSNGSNPWNGTLTVVSSGGHTSSTVFHVWVTASSPVAKIDSNATSGENKSGYLFIPWNTTLQFNAGLSTVAFPNVLSDAVFKLSAKDFNATKNNSVSAGASVKANWSVAFGSGDKPGNGAYLNFSNLTINGSHPSEKGFGWMYNLTLTVTSGVGTTAATTLVILVSDTQKPTASFSLDNAAGTQIGASGIVEGSNHSAVVRLNATAATDPGNGSIVRYAWQISMVGNSTVLKSINATKAKPLPVVVLPPENKSYRVNLTITDRNGNKANSSQTLTVAPNTTSRPILQARNLTGPSSVTVGSTYTFWVNVTAGGGAKAVAQGIQVTFFLRGSSGTGSKTVIAGSPGSVVFYNYSNNTTNATVNATPTSTGTYNGLAYNSTIRAQVSWTPSTSGSFTLYANVTAQNEYNGSYSVNVVSTPVTVKPNSTTQDIEYAGIAVVVIAVIGALVFVYRRRARGPRPPKSSSTTGKGGLERGPKSADDDDDA